MQFFGGARKGGEILNRPGVCLVSCGLNYAAFNAASPVGADQQGVPDFDRSMSEAVSYFVPRGLRWTYWTCDDYLDRAYRAETRHIFTRAGLHPLTEAPGMYAEKLTEPAPRLPEMEVRAG